MPSLPKPLPLPTLPQPLWGWRLWGREELVDCSCTVSFEVSGCGRGNAVICYLSFCNYFDLAGAPVQRFQLIISWYLMFGYLRQGHSYVVVLVTDSTTYYEVHLILY